jgi:hypothetical protein
VDSNSSASSIAPGTVDPENRRKQRLLRAVEKRTINYDVQRIPRALKPSFADDRMGSFEAG